MINRVNTYTVAGHKFRFCLPDNPKLWGAFEHQYNPFLTESVLVEGENPCDCVEASDEFIFTLCLADELPQCERQCVYDSPTEDGETVVKLHRGENDWLFESTPDHRLPINSRVWASADFRMAALKLETKRVSDAIFGVNNAAMLLYAFSTACLDTIEMHASVIGNGGKAYLFLGKSGTGKSTHSSLWLKHIEGSELMNDDNPIVRAYPDGSVVAYGSPWSGKTPCYKNVEAPIGAYVQIRQCPENKIRKMNVLEGYSSLFSSISGIKDDDSAMADGLNSTIDKVLTNVPFYLLDCRPDQQAAELCAATVRK